MPTLNDQMEWLADQVRNHAPVWAAAHPATAILAILEASGEMAEALWACRSVLDEILGDSDLIGAEDDSPEFIACQKASFALAAYEQATGGKLTID